MSVFDPTAYSNEELMTLLLDEDKSLRNRLSQIPEEELTAWQASLPQPQCSSSDAVVNINHEGFSESVANRALPGIFIRTYRKGNHASSNESFRIELPWGGVNFGYNAMPGHDAGTLFECGTFERTFIVKRPIWVGIGQVTYHDRIEVFLADNWKPSGVLWWGECWGWYGTGFQESDLCRWRVNFTFNC